MLFRSFGLLDGFSGDEVGHDVGRRLGYGATVSGEGDAASIGANTFQFFTRNPRGGKAKALDPSDMQAFRQVCEEEGIVRILAHAPYTLNPASANDPTCEFALATLADDLARMEETPGQLYNMHPGSHVGQGAQAGIEKIAAALNSVLDSGQTTTVLLETMAGKETEVGRTFEELAAIIERVELIAVPALQAGGGEEVRPPQQGADLGLGAGPQKPHHPGEFELDHAAGQAFVFSTYHRIS